MVFRLSIRNKLLFSTLLILLVSYAILIYTTVKSISSFLEENLTREMRVNLKHAEHRYYDRARDIEQSLLIPVSAAAVKERILRKDQPWLRDTLLHWQKALPFVDVFVITDSSGKVVARLDNDTAGDHLKLGAILEQARREKKPVIATESVSHEFLATEGKSALCPQTGECREAMMATVVIPVLSETAQLIGVVVAGDILNHDQELPRMVKDLFGREKVIASIAHRGRLIAGSSTDGPQLPDAVAPDVLIQLEKEGSYRGEVRFGAKIYETVMEPLRNSAGETVGSLSIALPKENFSRALHDLLTNILASALVGILLAIAIAWLVSRRLMRPIREMAESVERIEAGDLQQRVVITTSDELGFLADSFNRMCRTLAERDRTIRAKTFDLEELNLRLQDLNELLERKVAGRTAELKLEMQRLEGILTSMAEGMVVTDRENSIIFFNPAAQRIFGMLPHRVVGRPISEVCGKGEFCGLQEQIRAIHDGEREQHEVTISIPGKHLRVKLSPLLSETGEFGGVVISIRDATLEREVDQMKTEFISMVSHELKTPLTSMKGSLQYILGRGEGCSETVREMLTVCLRNTDRLIRLIGEILDIAKIEAGKMEMTFRPLRIEQIVVYTMEEIGGFAQIRGVELASEIPAGLPPVYGDHDRLIQVLGNLLSNAIKFSPAGKRIMVSARQEGNYMLVSVSDQGEQIAVGDRERLFRKFQQLKRLDQQQHRGTGLGLAICKEIIERHHGRIAYGEGEGGGNVFTFSVPVYEEQ